MLLGSPTMIKMDKAVDFDTNTASFRHHQVTRRIPLVTEGVEDCSAPWKEFALEEEVTDDQYLGNEGIH